MYTGICEYYYYARDVLYNSYHNNYNSVENEKNRSTRRKGNEKNGLPYVCDGSVTQNRHQYLSDVLDIAVTVKLWIPNILILI